MLYYVPRPFHAAVAAFICILLIALGARAQGRVLMALNIGAFMFAVIAAVLLWLLVIKAYDEHWETIARFAEVYSRMDDESRAALGFHFPNMRYKMKRGEVREMFEDTNVPMEMFKLFLKTSNAKYISPRRDWYKADQPEWAWVEIQGWLEENGFIIPDSASGSHSWLWNGDSWNHLKAYWGAGMKLTEMKDMRAFAYETTTSPLAEDVGGGWE